MSTQNTHTHNSATISITDADSGSDYRVYVRTNFSNDNWAVFDKTGYSWADVYNGVLIEGLSPGTPYAANVQTPSGQGVWLGATTFITHAAPAESNTYIWNGSSWVVAVPYIWNGSSWILASSKIYPNAWS
jgi:hypothetical protein